MYVKHAEKDMHLSDFVRKVYLELLNFQEYSELPNLSTNLKKLSNGHTERVSVIEKLVCMPRPLARDDLCGMTFNVGNWWTVILYIYQHSGHRKKTTP